ncbi:hypothetical protein AABB24_028076, partial [Solanum stoloniferum]
MGNTTTTRIAGTKKVMLKMTSNKVFTLNNVLHVPTIRKNLVFVAPLFKNAFKCVLVSDKVVISKNEMFLGKGYLTEGLFKLNVMVVDSINKNSTSVYLLESNDLWHACLGHVNYKALHKLITLQVLPDFKCDKSICEICVESKFVKQPYKFVDWNSKPLDLIHTDICDMKLTPSRDGKKYFITLIDDCTRFCYVYLLNSKDETIYAFKQYKNEVENQLNLKIKMIWSDRGGEYESPFAEIWLKYRIIHQTTAPYTPQSNGLAERKNRTLK